MFLCVYSVLVLQLLIFSLYWIAVFFLSLSFAFMVDDSESVICHVVSNFHCRHDTPGIHGHNNSNNTPGKCQVLIWQVFTVNFVAVWFDDLDERQTSVQMDRWRFRLSLGWPAWLNDSRLQCVDMLCLGPVLGRLLFIVTVTCYWSCNLLHLHVTMKRM